MPDQTAYYKPNKLYDLRVKIKDLDYTNEVVEVVFTSSLSTAYQVVDIVFFIDPNNVIVEDIFGDQPIKLTINLLREQDYPGPSIDVELMYLNASFQMTEKANNSQGQIADRTYFMVTTVVRKAYKTMTTLVNDVYIGTTINDIISSLSSTVGTTINYDSNGRNTIAIDQCIVPPTTLYKVIKEYDRMSTDAFDGYLDQRFGLFSGTPGVFCQFDNKVYIKNLTNKLTKDQTFTVYQLAGGLSKKDTDKIYDETVDGKVFYTYDSITTDYAGNAKFADLASNVNHIVLPNNKIFSVLSQNLKDIAKDYSLLYSQKNKNLFIDSYAERKKYYNEDTGFNEDLTIFNSRFGRSLSTLSTISLNLERNLPVLNLINVGECVKFKPTTIEYQDFEGKYILWSSVVSFTRSTPSWESVATINLTRTNKKN